LMEVSFSDYSVREATNSRTIEACAFDASTYVNSEAAAQNAARVILHQFGAVVIVPRLRLSPGRYVVTLDAGQRYTWSFSIASPEVGNRVDAGLFH
jgi:hypothetical protein